MPKNQSNKGTENRCEYLVDIANNYNENENENEKHHHEYESVLNATVNKVKIETRAGINKLNDADKDLGSECSKVRTK